MSRLALFLALIAAPACHSYTWTTVTEWGKWPEDMIFHHTKKLGLQGICRPADEAESDITKSGRSLGNHCWLPWQGKEVPMEVPFQVLSSEPLLEVLYWADTTNERRIRAHAVRSQEPQEEEEDEEEEEMVSYVCAVPDVGPGSLVITSGEELKCMVGYKGRETVHLDFQILMREDPNVYILKQVDYHLDKIQIVSDKPVQLVQTTVVNYNDFNQAMRRTIDISKTREATWEHGLGFSPFTDIKVESGIPYYNHNEWVVDKAGEVTYSPGTAHTQTFHARLDAFLNVPANSRCVVSIVAREQTISVPYSATLQTVFQDGHEKSDLITGYYNGMEINQEEVQYEACTSIDD